MFYIYIIENKLNNSMYVGKSNSPKERWRIHKAIAKGWPTKYKKRCSYIHKAINKYGSNNFEFNIIEAFSSEDECFRAEEYWIYYLNNQGVNIYNITNGGEGLSGYRHTDETKIKMSKNSKPRSGKDRPLFGVGHSDESKKKMSETKIKNGHGVGEKNSMFGRLGEDAPCFGRKGDLHPNSKITDEHLKQLRIELDKAELNLTQLAKKYNVSVSTISNIKSRKTRK